MLLKKDIQDMQYREIKYWVNDERFLRMNIIGVRTWHLSKIALV